MTANSLAEVFKKPSTLDEHLESIHTATPIVAVARIKTIAANKDDYGPDQVLVILETALTREVRTNPQRRCVIQEIKRSLKKLTPMPKPTATTIPVEVLPAESLAAPSTSFVPSIEEINALHHAASAEAEQAKALGESATRKAILLGLKLSALKTATPHGQWESLFASGQKRVGKPNVNHGCHLLDFGFETARRYISVAANLMSQRLTAEQSAALMEIAARPETVDLSPAEASFLDEVVPEKSLRQLYLSMGIVRPTKKEAFALAAQEDATTHAPPPPKKKGPMSLAEQRKAKRDEARLYWFGSTSPGMVGKNSLMLSLIEEAKNPAECQLHLLSAEDLAEVETTLKDVLKVIKTIKA